MGAEFDALSAYMFDMPVICIQELVCGRAVGTGVIAK